MKKSILLLLCIVLFASCAGEYGLMKRRYNKGYYVSVSKKPRQETRTPKKTAERQDVLLPVAEETVVPPSATAVAGQIKPPTSALRQSADPTRHTIKNRLLASAGSNAYKQAEIKALPERSVLRAVVKKHTRGAASDVDTLVLAILCIFIPPLAVFLFQNAITIDFWIDLILTLLFWLPGIIFAFLVCFGGVSLG